ncbi:MAG: glycosyltransferase [Candidatus Pacebacteria bacterium]|nr:glycosyltransferase [Candidatus Paceibacterota bacterium]MDD5722067.1 glycosyltransferase [Candidatus Paceibacterota bacterium]
MKSKYIIFVNDTAATEGGALTILRQFLSNISKYSPENFIYYVFCSLEELKQYESDNIKIINDIKGKKRIDRIKWDLFGLKKWSQKHNIKADLLISLQNTGIRYYKNTKQIAYIHQPLSFYQIKRWKLFNKDERGLWFYQNIYKKIIQYGLRKDTHLVVQTETMKKAMQKQLKRDDSKIKVIKPSLEKIEIEKIKTIDFGDNKFHIFYPAATFPYKNHEIIIEALRLLKNQEKNIYQNLVVHFTFEADKKARSTKLIKLINQKKVEDAIILEGQIPYDKALSLYKSSDLLVFPSYIESLGLPMIEAAMFGLPILVSSVDINKEVLQDYKGARFLDYNNPQAWAEAIKDAYFKKQKFPEYKENNSNNWSQFFALIKGLIYNEIT